MKLTTLVAALAVTVAFAQSAHARELSHRYGVHHETGRHRVAYRYAATRAARYNSAWRYHGGGSVRLVDAERVPRRIRRTPARLVQLADAAAHRQRSGPAIQPRAQLDALRTPRTGRHRRRGRMAASRRQDRRPPRRHVVIQSGNDGNRLRTRPLSIGGAIAIRWG